MSSLLFIIKKHVLHSCRPEITVQQGELSGSLYHFDSEPLLTRIPFIPGDCTNLMGAVVDLIIFCGMARYHQIRKDVTEQV
jgi:hypothetical protein